MKKSPVLWQHLADLFYPRTCVCCGVNLLDQEHLICITCQFDLPLVDNQKYESNVVTRIFEGRIPIELGASYAFYHELGKTKQLIHELKYRNQQNIGITFANWLGHQMKRSGAFCNIDCIVPVPLHRKKLKKRGYNQLTKFGKRLGEILGIEYREDILQRVSFTQTQTKKKRLDRFQNTSSRFVLNEPELIAQKHVLLIDDVITTGATLEACCKELLKAKGVKISIVTMAVTE
jgi:ComF family protein